jgi:hypothetical protein
MSYWYFNLSKFNVELPERYQEAGFSIKRVSHHQWYNDTFLIGKKNSGVQGCLAPFPGTCGTGVAFKVRGDRNQIDEVLAVIECVAAQMKFSSLMYSTTLRPAYYDLRKVLEERGYVKEVSRRNRRYSRKGRPVVFYTKYGLHPIYGTTREEEAEYHQTGYKQEYLRMHLETALAAVQNADKELAISTLENLLKEV